MREYTDENKRSSNLYLFSQELIFVVTAQMEFY